MTKWFDRVENDASGIISSRVRLARNWDEYKFPSRLTDEEARLMIHRLREKLTELPELEGKNFIYRDMEAMEELDRLAFRERRLLNRTLVEKQTPGALICSEDESESLVFNADDHIRLQILNPGLNLEQSYETADRIDDFINERIPYAFNSRYGYLTSYPTNVGTAMKASVVVHLPSLSSSRRFQDLLGDMSRFGTAVRGVMGRQSENDGDLYEVYNQKTLGMTEHEILDLVGSVALQLSGQEIRFRQMSLEKHRLLREDEAYKSYAILKYARKLSLKEALMFLSHLRAGIADGLLSLREEVSIYALMVGSQQANLQKQASRPLGKEELETARARFIRENLPDLK